ncbi:MAG TPA: hypothetical protein VJM81_04700 [Rhizorhapis sp.]|nr:hypothetical protein [Rhizorhapis sp.]
MGLVQIWQSSWAILIAKTAIRSSHFAIAHLLVGPHGFGQITRDGVFVWHSNRKNLMRMLSIFTLPILAATAQIALAAPATAEPLETGSFEHEGYTYVYKVAQKGESQVITGRRYPGGVPFSLKVREGTVKGTSNGLDVKFNLEEARGAAAGAKLSMR